MKKCLLSLAVSLLFGSSLASAEFAKFPNTVQKTATSTEVQSRAATDDGYQLRFCGDLYTWYNLTKNNNTTYQCYIEISPEVATSLAGNTLTDINFCACIQSATSKLGSVFVSEDLAGDPVVSQDVTIKNGYNGNSASVQQVTLETPYVIKEGVGFAYGYTVTKCTTSDYPVGVDAGSPTQFAGNVNVYSSTNSQLVSCSLAEDVGSNLFLYANTVGDKHVLDNIFSLSGLTVGGDFTLPVTTLTDGTINALAAINNLGSNSVTSIDYTYSVNGSDPVAASVEVEIAPETLGTALLPVQGVPSGRQNVDIVVTAINGFEFSAGTTSTVLAIEGEGYSRRFVVEEGTGTGCGYCPRGIVGMETMAEKYPDTFIGVAIHCDWFGTDPMTVASYQSFLRKYFEGLPSCIINRDPIYNIDPSPDMLELAYEFWGSQVGAADVDIKVTKPKVGEMSMKVDASTVFAYDDAAANYALAFVIIEDGYMGFQSNYYAGGQLGPMGGWESKGSRVAWTYTDVARSIFDVYGLRNSVPTSVENGVPYEYSYSMSLKDVKNIEKTSVIALVLDKTSGTILNAKKVGYADYEEPVVDGISNITSDQNAPVEYYNIQGVRMEGDNLPAGLYIIRQGDKVQKSIIR